MKKLLLTYIAAFFVASLCLALAPVAFCSDITGGVSGPQGPVAGAQITVTDSGGNVVGQAASNDAGTYCITGLSPGNYKTAVNPPAGAGFQAGTVNGVIPEEGLTEDWSLTSAQVAVSSANSPGACGGFILGGLGLGGLGVAGATALGVGIVAGGVIGGYAAAGGFNGATHVASPAI
jgi:hypothetical protein